MAGLFFSRSIYPQCHYLFSLSLYGIYIFIIYEHIIIKRWIMMVHFTHVRSCDYTIIWLCDSEDPKIGKN